MIRPYAAIAMLLTACGGGDPALCAGDVMAEVNAARATPRQCGATSYAAVQPLTPDAVLTQAAQRHAEDLAKTGATSHTGADGSSVTDRAKAYGRPVGENVLTGDADLAHAMRDEACAVLGITPGAFAGLNNH